MPLPREAEQTAAPVVPCDVCAQKAESRIWDFNVCPECHGDWCKTAKASPPVKDDDPYETVCDKYKSYTATWVARKRTERARHSTNAPQPSPRAA